MNKNLWLLAFLSLIWTREVHAQTREEFVSSSLDGGSPYMLVFADERGGSRREPGIYVRGDGGSWIQAFKGGVTPKAVTGGMSLQLEMAESTDLHEAVVVKDGKLLLINVLSRENDPSSYLVLGEGLASVRSPVTGDLIAVPNITSMDDLSVVARQTEYDEKTYQIILVSMKSDKVPHGEGVTFACAIEVTGEDERKPGFSLPYSPMILDWEFLDRMALADRLSGSNSDEFYGFNSRLLLSSFLKPRSNDSPALKIWRTLHQDYRDGKIDRAELEKNLTLASKRNVLDMKRSAPFIDVYTGEVEIEGLPTLKFSILGTDMVLVMDPQGNQSGIHFNGDESYSLTGLATVEPFIKGMPMFNKDGTVAIETSTPVDTGKLISVMRMSDGRVILLNGSNDYRDELDSIVLEPTRKGYLRKIPEDFSWTYFPFGNFLLCSWKFEGETFTSVYRLGLGGPKISIDGEHTISDAFYSSRELKARVSKHANQIVFDHSTPHTGSDDEYADIYRTTGLHVDLVRTIKGKPTEEPKQIFLEPLSEKALGEKLIYKVFEVASGIESKSGIYLIGGTKEEQEKSGEPFVRGEVVAPKNFSSEVLAQTTLEMNEKDLDDVEVTFLMVDAHFAHGDRGQLTAFFNPIDGKSSATSTPISKRPVPSDELLSFGFVNPVPTINEEKGDDKKKEKEGVTKKYQNGVLVSFYTYKDPSTGHTLTVVSEIQYERRGAKGIEISNFQDRIVETTDLSVEEIKSRILFDANNHAYWVKTPDRDRNDDRYQVSRITDGKDFRPAQDRTIKLRSLKDEQVEKDRETVRGSWRVSDQIPYGDKEAQLQREWLKNSPEFQTDVFPELRNLMDDLANIDRPARHVILVVPEDLLNYALLYPWALRYRESNRPEFWSSRNDQHQVFAFAPNETKVSQNEMFRNLGIMREQSARRRSLLISSIDRVRQVGQTPIDEEDGKGRDGFHLTNNKVASMRIGWAESKTDASDEKALPHSMYLLATEGQKIDLPQFRAKGMNKTSSMVLVGTAKQVEALKASMPLEASYGLFDDFETVELGPPTLEMRIKFALDNVTRHQLIRVLNYQPSLKGLVAAEAESKHTTEQAETKLMTYLVNRAEQLASDNKMPVFESFMRVLNELAQQLVTNPTYRSRRVIDRGIIEKTLSRVFPMPLNLSVLPEDDPLKICSRSDADLLWQRAGYNGPVSFKERVLKVILAQLATDEVRSVKSSAIIYGPSGSTKTRAVRTFFKMLGLKEYKIDGDSSENGNAWSFVLNMGRVLGSKAAKDTSSTSEKMISFEDAKKHFDLFLSGENGARGFIFLDDFHLAPDDVKAYFVKRIRGLQDERTYKTVQGLERPTRNISIILALNPIDTPERIKKFAKHPAYPTDAELILATLSSGDGSNDVERSFLTRFTDLINLGRFSSASKGPALLNVLTPARQTAFSNSQRILFVSPQAIDSLIDHSPHSDARTFLSAGSSALMKLPKGSHHLYVVTGRRAVDAKVPAKPADEWSISGGDEAQLIENYIESAFQAVSIEEGYAGKIELLKYVVSNFRLKVYETILQAVSENRDFMKRPEFRQQIVLPLALAVHRQLQDEPEPFLRDIFVDPSELGAAGEAQKHLFAREYEKMIYEQEMNQKRSRKDLPVGDNPPHNALFSLGIGERSATNSRQHVTSATVASFAGIAHRMLSSVMQSRDVNALSQPEEWLKGKFEDKNLVQEFSQAITQEIETYYRAIHDNRLQQAEGTRPMTSYESMRLFVMSIDRAIARQRWGHVLKFLVETLEVISNDMSVGQSPQVQNLLFKSSSSIFTPLDKGLVLSLAKSLPNFDFYKADEERWDTSFRENCTGLLSMTGQVLQ